MKMVWPSPSHATTSRTYSVSLLKPSAEHSPIFASAAQYLWKVPDRSRLFGQETVNDWPDARSPFPRSEVALFLVRAQLWRTLHLLRRARSIGSFRLLMLQRIHCRRCRRPRQTKAAEGRLGHCKTCILLARDRTRRPVRQEIHTVGIIVRTHQNLDAGIYFSGAFQHTAGFIAVWNRNSNKPRVVRSGAFQDSPRCGMASASSAPSRHFSPRLRFVSS